MNRNYMFMRLCHHCSKLNEAESEILKCLFCEKGFLAIRSELNPGKQKSEFFNSELDSQEIVFSPIPGLVVFW